MASRLCTPKPRPQNAPAFRSRVVDHYLYCSHRWGLIHINDAWAENYFIARADIMHERAHSGADYFSRGKKVYTAVNIWDDTLGLQGVVDCLEENGDELCIVEYKPSAPKNASQYRYEDAMQVFAQKVCVDSIFNCNASACLYYADNHKRVELPFLKEYDHYYKNLHRILGEMRGYLEKGVIPPVVYNKKCSGCSMKDMCLPKTAKRKYNLLQEIQKSINET